MKKSNQENKKKNANPESKAAVPAQRFELLPRWMEEFEQMRKDLFQQPFSELWQPFRGMRTGGFSGLTMPVVDLFEEKDNVVVKAEMPG